MNIEQQVKEAIEEFGGLAHDRFEYADLGWSNCTSNDYLSPQCFILRLKPLPELFSHDVKVYGDNAYLMWDKMSSNRHALDIIRQDARGTFFRKTSAARPFDLKLAKDGDVVEFIDSDNTSRTVKFIKKCDDWRCLVEWSEHDRDLVTTDKLRMKYPKKVQND